MSPGFSGYVVRGEVVRRHALQHRGGGLPRRHAVRKLDEPLRGHDGQLGVRALDTRVGDAVADGGLAYARADGGHDARGLLAERERQLGAL